jgi:hypothetical protein
MKRNIPTIEKVVTDLDELQNRRNALIAELDEAEQVLVHQMLDAGSTWVGIADYFDITTRQASNRFTSRRRFRDSEVCAARRRKGIQRIASERVAQ